MMKKLIVTGITLVLLAGMAPARETTAAAIITGIPAGDSSSCSWDNTSHDFGKLVQGKPVSTVFTLTNTGKKPLIIQSVHSPCGCTVSSYTREPVMPGKTGTVTLTFNAAKTGSFHKVVTVTANTSPATYELSISGEVNEEGIAN